MRGNSGDEQEAGRLAWYHCDHLSDIIAFRVTKPYRELRVWWLAVQTDGRPVACDSASIAQQFAGIHGAECVRVVEQPE
jgi:hypothetical protein